MVEFVRRWVRKAARLLERRGFPTALVRGVGEGLSSARVVAEGDEVLLAIRKVGDGERQATFEVSEEVDLLWRSGSQGLYFGDSPSYRIEREGKPVAEFSVVLGTIQWPLRRMGFKSRAMAGSQIGDVVHRFHRD